MSLKHNFRRETEKGHIGSLWDLVGALERMAMEKMEKGEQIDPKQLLDYIHDLKNIVLEMEVMLRKARIALSVLELAVERYIDSKEEEEAKVSEVRSVLDRLESVLDWH